MTDTAPSASSLKRRAPILAIFAAALLALIFLGDWLSFDRLAENRAALLALRDAHYLAVSAGFLLVYSLAVVLSLPGSLILTLTGGFLFGIFPGLAYNVLAATLGASLVFLAARAGFGQDIAQGVERRGGAAARLAQGLRDNEIWVLLTMRLIPVVPFFVANLAAAVVGVRFRAFVLTTFLGIIPAGFIYTALGAGLGDLLARGETPDLGLLFQPRFLLPLLGLAALSSVPLLLKLRR